MAPDVWAPHVSGSEREGGRRRGGPLGLKLLWAGAGAGLGWLFFFFFSFLFKSNFKPISKPFKFKSFSTFQTQILTQIYSNILRLLENFFKHF
jgi:hypothetical protein